MPIKDIKPGLKNINVIFIVLEIGTATVTKENREVRNFKVGDHTACINVSIWDEPGKLIVPGDIIKLTKGYASIWRHCLTLYSGKNGEIFKIGEYCMSFNEMVNMSEPKRPEQAVAQQQQSTPSQIPPNGSNNTTNVSAANPTTNTGNGGTTATSRAASAHVGKVTTPQLTNVGTVGNNNHTQKALNNSSVAQVTAANTAVLSNSTNVSNISTTSAGIVAIVAPITSHKSNPRNSRAALTRSTNLKAERR